MSYAGPANPKKSARPNPRPNATRPLTPSSSHTERNAAFITGVVLGAALGAGVALLLAPRSGRSTRRRLASRGRNLGRRGRDAWHDLSDEFREMRRRRKETAREGDADASPSNGHRKSFSIRAASSL